MKIRKVKWKNHPILKNLELDFTDGSQDSKIVYDNIVLVGENGTGKTTILETIYNFLNIGPIDIFDYIEYQIDDNIYKAIYFDNGTENGTSFYMLDKEGNKTFIHSDKVYGWLDEIKKNLNDPRNYGCAYTKARSVYPTKAINYITTNTVDEDNSGDEFDDATSLKQLIVDVDAQDNSRFADLTRKDRDVAKSWSEYEPKSLMYRFSSAFNKFFDGALKYSKVERRDTGIEVLFEKNGKEILLDKLSTGESQIVFRGIYLLRNLKKLYGGIIFIDEPEISMHPSWQKKIFTYYTTLFIDNEVQKSQIIMATHSQFVVEEALSLQNTKIIILKNNKRSIRPVNFYKDYALDYLSSAEIAYIAFGLYSTAYHNELYGCIKENWYDEFKEIGAKLKYIRLFQGNEKKLYVCLSDMIRHIIHHPENKKNKKYTDKQFKKSINRMRRFILKKKRII